MTLHVHLAAEEEPAEFHPAIGTDDRVFAVQLALEVKDATDEGAAQTSTSDFLGELGNLRVAHVVLTNTYETWRVTYVERVAYDVPAVPVSARQGPSRPEKLMNWLDTCKAEYGKLNHDDEAKRNAMPFYADTARGTGDMRNARAVDLMRSTWRWPAPLAQNCGLVFPVAVPKLRQTDPVDAREFLILLPDGIAEVTNGKGQQSLDVWFELHDDRSPVVVFQSFCDQESPYRYWTETVALPPLNLPPRFQKNGLYNLPADPEAMQRLLARVQERAAAHLWGATVLGTHAQGDGHVAFLVDPSDPDLYSGEKLRWLARASAVSVFDIAIAGLLLPKSNTSTEVKRRSAVLERLTRRIAARLELDPGVDVDEEQLYENLHEALWTSFSQLGTGILWTSIQATHANPETLPRIADALTSNNPAPDLSAREWADALSDLSNELGSLAVLLESEAGGEKWLKAQFEALLHPGSHIGLYDQVAGIKNNPDATPDALAAEFQGFLKEIDTEFDAMETLRNEFGAEAMRAVVGTRLDVGKLREAIRLSEPLKHRFTDPHAPGVMFDGLWTASILTGPLPAGLETFVASALDDSLEVLTRDPDNRDDFRPDDRPLPLLIPVADAPDAFAGEGKTEFFSGLGFLVQSGPAHKTDAPFDEPPVHLNLIALNPNLRPDPDVEDTTPPEDVPHVPVLDFAAIEKAVDPLLPMPAPGLEGMTMPYTGAPLSSPGRAEPALSALSQEQVRIRNAVAAMRPFVKAEHVYDAAERLPDLAYGKAYRFTGFWVPPSGVLPIDLQSDDDATHGKDPFTPKSPDKNSAFWPSGKAWLCRRRTAVAGSALTALKPTWGLDAIPDEVHPISKDQPRIALDSLRHGYRHVDLYRGSDGKGVLGATDTVITLRGVSASEDFDCSTLEVSIRTGTKGEGETIPSEHITYSNGTLRIEILMPPDFFWLRLRFKDGNPSQAVSFIDPLNHRGQSTADRTMPTVLLAPENEPDVWKIARQRQVRIDAPRVSFEDFERWAANEALWRETCGAEDDAGPRKLLDALRVAHALFETVGGVYAERLKSLPDPAVSGFLLSLAVADRTKPNANHHGKADQDEMPLHPYATALTSDKLAAIHLDGDFDANTELADILQPFDDLVGVIDAAAKLVITLTADDETLELVGGANVEARIPEATVAHLQALPMVDDAFFESADDGQPLKGIFHPRMKELSVGLWHDRGRTFRLFGGPAVAAEVMTQPEKETPLPAGLIAARISGRARGYRLDAVLTDDFRQFSEADLVTQRWRFDRPIYRWINPAVANRVPGIRKGPIVAVGDTACPVDAPCYTPPAETLAKFEADLFGLRRFSDGDFKRFRLSAPGQPTELQRFDWPERSATYFRHRLELISRYTGALVNRRLGRIGAKAPKDGGLAAWQARLAVLAEPDAASLVRPQVRAFLPLMGRPRNGSSGPTPLTCVLSEPPFAQLGLADRIDAELAMKPLFRDDGLLRVSEMRKEISPDPLLSVFSVRPGPSRQARILAEGPAGLHFDRADAEAPAWSNSQYMLHVLVPEEEGSATHEELEESFAGVVLTRRADDGWSWYDPDSAALGSAERDQWLPLQEGRLTLSNRKDGESAVTYAAITKHGENVRLEVLKSAIFEDGGDDMSAIYEGNADAILLKPLGDRRYRLSVYATSAGDPQNGTADGYQLISSLVLFTRGEVPVLLQATVDGEIAAYGRAETFPGRQSDATLMEWVRSSRDMSALAFDDTERKTDVHIAPAGDAVFFCRPADTNTPIRVTTPMARRRYPLHVHRRLVAIRRRPSQQIGDQVALASGSDLTENWAAGAYLTDDWGAVRGLAAQRGESLILAEMECRAETVFAGRTIPDTLKGVLGVGAAAHHARFRAAIFDLTSTRKTDTPPAQVRFHIRAADAALRLGALSVSIHAGDNPERQPEQPSLVGTLPDEWNNLSAHAIDLILDGENGTRLRAVGRDKNGAPLGPSVIGQGADGLLARLVREPEALTLNLDYQDEAGVWLDVSMLHSRRVADDSIDAFDFDWIFGSSSAGDPLDQLPLAVAPRTLNRLTEVQARLIGITDPYPIVHS